MQTEVMGVVMGVGQQKSFSAKTQGNFFAKHL